MKKETNGEIVTASLEALPKVVKALEITQEALVKIEDLNHDTTAMEIARRALDEMEEVLR